ncbi:hypothetical protein [Zavarzinia sp.]|uniref:hypothetical protein n=1 Tax=Zavarzinia sp. TaxID=2027920 RepID=UPI003BB5A576
MSDREQMLQTELEAQAVALADAMWAAAVETAKAFGTLPAANAMLAALASLEGQMLGHVVDARHRRILARQLDVQRRAAQLRTMARRNAGDGFQTYTIGGPLNG